MRSYLPQTTFYHTVKTPPVAQEFDPNVLVTVTPHPTLLPRRQRIRWSILLGLVVTLFVAIVTFMLALPRDNQSALIVSQLKSSHRIVASFTPHRNTMTSDDMTTLYAATLVSRVDPMDNTLLFDGHISYRVDNVIHNYTLVGNIGTYSTQEFLTGTLLASGCLEPSQLPPLHLIEVALQQAEVLDVHNGAGLDESCADGSLMSAIFEGETYVYCKHADATLSRVESQDLSINLQVEENVKEHNETAFIEIPTLLTHLNCTPIAPERATVTVSDAATADNNVTESDPSPPPTLLLHRALQRIKYHADAVSERVFATKRRNLLFGLRKKSCGCRGKKRPCLIVHGLGRDTDGGLTSYSKKGFKHLEGHSPCCSSYHYTNLNTNGHPWYSHRLSKAVCKAAMDVSGATNRLAIDNLIVITHSMGNLMMAGALATHECGFDRSTDWIGLAGPMLGAEMANMVMKNCYNPSFWQKLPQFFLTLFGRCPVNPATNALACPDKSFSEMSERYRLAQEAYASYTTAAMCGSSATGINSLDSFVMKAGSLLHGLFGGVKGVGDGVVELNSCKKPLKDKPFGKSYRNRWYEAKINHNDASFNHGDGWWGAHRKPVKWMECLL